MSSTPQGNYIGLFDAAIVIGSSNVALDLNGFTIAVNDLLGEALGHPFYGIADAGAFSQISVTNGAVRMTTNTNRIALKAISVAACAVTRFENLNLAGKQPILDLAPPFAVLLSTGVNSLVRHVVTNGAIHMECPSTAIENVALIAPGAGCVLANNSTNLTLTIP